MTVKPETVLAMNEAQAHLALTPGRIAELPIELNQLRDAIERVAGQVVFDSEPSDFRSVLLSFDPEAGEGGR